MFTLLALHLTLKWNGISKYDKKVLDTKTVHKFHLNENCQNLTHIYVVFVFYRVNNSVISIISCLERLIYILTKGNLKRYLTVW